jgi:hypothetical protein
MAKVALQAVIQGELLGGQGTHLSWRHSCRACGDKFQSLLARQEQWLLGHATIKLNLMSRKLGKARDNIEIVFPFHLNLFSNLLGVNKTNTIARFPFARSAR